MCRSITVEDLSRMTLHSDPKRPKNSQRNQVLMGPMRHVIAPFPWIFRFPLLFSWIDSKTRWKAAEHTLII